MHLSKIYTQAVKFKKQNILKLLNGNKNLKVKFLDLGGFDENITGFEDWDLANKTKAEGVKIERINEFILHDEGKIDFRGSTKKKSYYAKWWHIYQAKYPEISKQQLNPFLRFPIKKLLFQAILHPVLFVSMVIMKLTEQLNFLIKG